MDKLKQVLKYQFWILLGLAVLLPLVGWFLASSGLAKGYEEREKKLSARFNELKASVADPNADWENRLKQVNTVQELEARKVWVALWEAQQSLKTWPAKLSTNDPTKFTNADLGFYRKNYMQLREEVYTKLQPVVESEEEGKPPQGLVSLPLADFPISPSESLAGSSTTPPSPQEVEEAQEDLWLAQALIQVINYLNRDATSQLDAVIPEVRVIQLRGGNRADGKAKSTPKNSGGGGGGGGTSGAASMGEMMAGGMKDMIEKGKGQSGMGGVGGGGSQASSTIGAIPAVSFNPDEELGEEGDKPKRRYVEERDEWRTRGFYLEVKINQTRVPELLVALSSLQWPARVSRVHVADVREEELIPAGSAGSNAGMMTGGGAGVPGMTGAMAGMAGGGAAAMKGMGEAMSKGMSKAGGGMGAGVGGTMINRTKPAAAGGGGGLPGADAGGTGASTQKRDGIDPLNNPNLVNLALDGWFTIFKKPKPEVLALVYPPATETTPGTASPGVPASAGATSPGNTPATPGSPAGSNPATPGQPVSTNPAAGPPAGNGGEVPGEPSGGTNPAATASESPASGDEVPSESNPATDAGAPADPATPEGDAAGETTPESSPPPTEPAPSAGGQP
ncbi:MAG: hypothetical protein ACKO3P_09285 [Planctomycetaceae bacterium]